MNLKLTIWTIAIELAATGMLLLASTGLYSGAQCVPDPTSMTIQRVLQRNPLRHLSLLLGFTSLATAGAIVAAIKGQALVEALAVQANAVEDQSVAALPQSHQPAVEIEAASASEVASPLASEAASASPPASASETASPFASVSEAASASASEAASASTTASNPASQTQTLLQVNTLLQAPDVNPPAPPPPSEAQRLERCYHLFRQGRLDEAVALVQEQQLLQRCAATRLSILFIGPPGVGKSVTILAFIAYLFDRHPEADIRIAGCKNDRWLGLAHIPGLFGCLQAAKADEPYALPDLSDIIAQIRHTYQEMMVRLQMSEAQRQQLHPCILLVDDYFAIYNHLKTMPRVRGQVAAVDYVSSCLNAMVTLGRVVNVRLVLGTQGANLDALGLNGADIRASCSLLAIGKLTVKADGQLDGGFDAIALLLKNPYIITDRPLAARLAAPNGPYETLKALAEATQHPLAISTQGAQTHLLFLQDYRWAESYQLPKLLLAKLLVKQHQRHPIARATLIAAIAAIGVTLKDGKLVGLEAPSDPEAMPASEPVSPEATEAARLASASNRPDLSASSLQDTGSQKLPRSNGLSDSASERFNPSADRSTRPVEPLQDTGSQKLPRSNGLSDSASERFSTPADRSEPSAASLLQSQSLKLSSHNTSGQVEAGSASDFPLSPPEAEAKTTPDRPQNSPLESVLPTEAEAEANPFEENGLALRLAKLIGHKKYGLTPEQAAQVAPWTADDPSTPTLDRAQLLARIRRCEQLGLNKTQIIWVLWDKLPGAGSTQATRLYESLLALDQSAQSLPQPDRATLNGHLSAPIHLTQE